MYKNALATFINLYISGKKQSQFVFEQGPDSFVYAITDTCSFDRTFNNTTVF